MWTRLSAGRRHRIDEDAEARRKEERILYDQDDWVKHRSRRRDEILDDLALPLFGSFVALLWFAVFQLYR